MFEATDKWKRQCVERCVTSIGMRRDEAHFLAYLRKVVKGKGTVLRAKGGGRKDELKFLYLLVNDFVETMRLHGKYIDACDLEDYLRVIMQKVSR